MASPQPAFSVVIEKFRRNAAESPMRAQWMPPTPAPTPTVRIKREPRSRAPELDGDATLLNLVKDEEEVKPTEETRQKRKRRMSTNDEDSEGYRPSEEESDRADDVVEVDTPSPKKQKANASPKKKHTPLKYAPPETYAHIKGLTDALSWRNVLWFCGINPGKKSGETGCAYAHPSNHFWRGIAEAQLTTQREHPRASSDGTMPTKYNYGMTNLVDRVTSQETELSNKEKLTAVPTLLAKVQHFHPRMVTFIGKTIFDQIQQVTLHHARYVQTGALYNGGKAVPGSGPKGVAKSGPMPAGVRERSGLSPLRLKHANGDITYLYVQFSTSGLCRDAQYPDSVKIFRDIKSLVDHLRVDETGDLDARHPSNQWLELDVDAFLSAHPPPEVPASVRAALKLQTEDKKPPLISRSMI